jgi:hypothetical protein
MIVALFVALSAFGAWTAWRRNPLYSTRSTLRSAAFVLLAIAAVIGIIVAAVDLTDCPAPGAEPADEGGESESVSDSKRRRLECLRPARLGAAGKREMPPQPSAAVIGFCGEARRARLIVKLQYHSGCTFILHLRTLRRFPPQRILITLGR